MSGNTMLLVLAGIGAYVALVIGTGRYVRHLAKLEYQRGWNDAMNVAAEASACDQPGPSPEELIARGPLLWNEPPDGRRMFDPPYDQDA